MRAWLAALLLVCVTGCGAYAPAHWPEADASPDSKGPVEESESSDGA